MIRKTTEKECRPLLCLWSRPTAIPSAEREPKDPTTARPQPRRGRHWLFSGTRLRALHVLMALAAAAATSPGVADAAIVLSDPQFVAETVATLPAFTPVGLTFAPDGRIFIWQKTGVVRIVKNGALLPTPFLDIQSQVNQCGDRGLL